MYISIDTMYTYNIAQPHSSLDAPNFIRDKATQINPNWTPNFGPYPFLQITCHSHRFGGENERLVQHLKDHPKLKRKIIWTSNTSLTLGSNLLNFQGCTYIWSSLYAPHVCKFSSPMKHIGVVGINDEPPGTSILFIGCFNWMMNHIFTTKRGKTNQRSTKHLVEFFRCPGFKSNFLHIFFPEKSRPVFWTSQKFPMKIWRRAPWCSSLVLTWETATSKRRKDVPRTSRDETAASRWNVPSEAMEKKGAQTVGWVI